MEVSTPSSTQEHHGKLALWHSWQDSLWKVPKGGVGAPVFWFCINQPICSWSPIMQNLQEPCDLLGPATWFQVVDTGRFRVGNLHKNTPAYLSETDIMQENYENVISLGKHFFSPDTKMKAVLQAERHGGGGFLE